MATRMPPGGSSQGSKPIVVLTFDDAVSNHATVVGPLLQKYGFGATFYICELIGDGDDRFDTDKHQYLTWAQIEDLDRMGFEIGNHTGHHACVVGLSEEKLRAEIAYIEARCAEHQIPRPTTFCYPGGPADEQAVAVLQKLGFTFARICENRPYVPAQDNPLLVPSFVITDNEEELFRNALAQATEDQVIVFTFHGVPDYNHPWVTTSPERFQRFLDLLQAGNYRVISMRDLASLL